MPLSDQSISPPLCFPPASTAFLAKRNALVAASRRSKHASRSGRQAEVISFLPRLSNQFSLHPTSSSPRCRLKKTSNFFFPLSSEDLRRKSGVVHLPKYTIGREWGVILQSKIIQLNREFSMRVNITFLALESSWRNLLLGFFLAMFCTSLVLSSLVFGCGCQQDLPYSKVS